MAKTYGTPAVAKMVKIHYVTLHRWIADGKIKPHGIELADGRTLYQWTDADIEKAKKLKAENKPGRPPKAKK
jgi:predicted site-specific integrase-resolvase